MTRLRFLTAGESHGRALVAIIEGLPAGLPVSVKAISDELARRRHGYGRGPRMKIEKDVLEVTSGVRGGLTLGSPVALTIHNSEWAKWAHVMPVEGAPGGRELTRPRPGHADLPGMLKYDFRDARNVLERSSARETAARVAIAALAKGLLAELGVSIVSHVVRIGAAAVPAGARLPGPGSLDAIDASATRCLDEGATAAMVEAIDAAGAQGDSLGGVVEVIAFGLPPGLGSHVHWDRKLDGRLGGALMSVPAIKGVEVGDGFATAAQRGSESHDAIESDLSRATNRSGGTEGGMTTGGPLRVRAAMKPLSTLKKRLRSVDMSTGQQVEAFQERTDVCAVPAAGVVCEAVVALTLADALLEMLGGDTMADLRASLARYKERIEGRSDH
ncbi:MAG: chorismate synthase [Actinomycetota bacterium]|jgi:chorismate synthase|nr:chorismate synthase [Actinomycetota bacterium]